MACIVEMSTHPSFSQITQLIDVVELSKTQCTYPIHAQLKYATNQNFVGRIIDGYHPQATDFALMTPQAAYALCDVQNELLMHQNCGLFIYDAYRPKRAVQDFLNWLNKPPATDYELVRKAKHYPHLEKNQLFTAGYLIEDSGHCYGNTVDLVLVNHHNDQKLNMGSCFDYMGELSHFTIDQQIIGAEAYQNRLILRHTMQKFEFHPYDQEYWHFSHRGNAGREVSHALDIEITPNLRGKI